MTAHAVLRKAQKAMPRACGAWGLYRDGEFWKSFLSRAMADDERKLVQPGSKCEWLVARIRIEPKI